MNLLDKILPRNIFSHKNSKNKKHHDSIKNFNELQESEQAFKYQKKGMQSVPLQQIVGSVRRYNDFDNKFRLKQHLPHDRLNSIKKAMEAGKPLPPVDLYQIKDEYYVLDGNHRVAAAKEFGFNEINARIVECLPQKNSWENILYREKKDFYEKTGLDTPVEITEVGQYPYLLKQISFHQHFLKKKKNDKVPFEAAAEDWHDTIYVPFVNIIISGNIPKYFPQRTMGDFYTYLSYHQWGNWWNKKDNKSIDEYIFDNMEAFRKNMEKKQHAHYLDMQREMTAFILMNVETRKEKNILERLFAVEEIREVYTVHGNIDILAKVVLKRNLVSSDAEVIGSFVQDTIRAIPGIASTHTLIPSVSKKKE